MAGPRGRTRPRIMPALHYACFTPSRRFGKSAAGSVVPSPHPPFSSSLPPGASYVRERERERAGQLERESVPIEIDSIESSPHDPHFYRHAALCSAERASWKRRVRASMRSEIIRFSLPRSRCKLIGSDARSARRSLIAS